MSHDATLVSVAPVVFNSIAETYTDVHTYRDWFTAHTLDFAVTVIVSFVGGHVWATLKHKFRSKSPSPDGYFKPEPRPLLPPD